MQDLSGFSVPKGFRGGNAIKVQLWWAVQATIFAWSPQVLYRWRAFLLRLFGAKIGKNVVIRAAADEEGDFLLVSMMEDHVAYYVKQEIPVITITIAEPENGCIKVCIASILSFWQIVRGFGI